MKLCKYIGDQTINKPYFYTPNTTTTTSLTKVSVNHSLEIIHCSNYPFKPPKYKHDLISITIYEKFDGVSAGGQIRWWWEQSFIWAFAISDDEHCVHPPRQVSLEVAVHEPHSWNYIEHPLHFCWIQKRKENS